MAFCIKFKVFILYVFLVSIMGDTLAESESDVLRLLNRLDSKVDRLESTVEGLDNKLDTLILLGADRVEETATGSQTQTHVSSPAKDLPVALLSAQRISDPETDENRFVIRLKNNSDGELSFRIIGDGYDRGPNEVIAEEEDEVLAVHFRSQSATTGNNLFFQIMDSREENVTVIYLKNNIMLGSASQNLQNISLPAIQVRPEIEAVYDRGNNVTVEVTLLPDDPSAEELPSIEATCSGVDLTTMELKNHYGGMSKVIERKQYFKSPDTVDGSVTAYTAEHPISGYLSVYTQVVSRETSVVSRVQIMRSLVIRPSDQEGPFPHGYLAIYKDDYLPWRETSENGHEIKNCNAGEECRYECYASGETVSALTVLEILPNGSSVPVESQKNPPRFMSTMLSVSWTFQAQEDSGNSEGVTTFKCLAVDARTMSVADKYIDVHVILPGYIDNNRSSMIIHGDPEDSTIRHINLNCGIGGRPLPYVLFYTESSANSGPLTMLQEADSVIDLGANEGVARKSYTMTVDELRESGGFYCDVFSMSATNSSSHHFEVSSSQM